METIPLVNIRSYSFELHETKLFSYFIEYQSLLSEAEQLHQSALKITIDAFGEVNVQTAKHYGNLGRLYQSMGKYQV